MTATEAAPTSTTTGGPSLPQERRLVTAIPGPLSQERLARKQAHVADGVGTMLPVFVTAAGGGVLVVVGTVLAALAVPAFVRYRLVRPSDPA